ncbi:MAG: hypothetical protein KA773_20285 [Chloroflexi bacterium]|nr:hypothetical protein [Chloroflexota bacterium]
MEKICRGCRQKKPLTEFYKNTQNKDGLTTLCKSCAKEASRQYRTSPRGRAMRKLRRYKDRQKIQARDAVSNAIKRGELLPVQLYQCTHCDQPATTYHHYKGYKKEHFLDVEPVCFDCHRTIEADSEKANLGTEGLPLFEMKKQGE